MLSSLPGFDRFEPLFFDPARHRQSLPLLAASALAVGRADAAFAFADRSCRLGAPAARDFLLRALARRLAGHNVDARLDLARALEIDPIDNLISSCARFWDEASPLTPGAETAPSHVETITSLTSTNPRKPSNSARAAAVHVIVPVYENFEATRACFEALFAEGSSLAIRILAIDDASPNAAIRNWLAAQAANRRIDLLRNESNLGFAVSINRALAHCETGDVLLLNADAYLTPRSIERLAAAAHESDDIGAVTPFANNGEWTSFPLPNVVNPLADPALRSEIAEAAYAAHGSRVIDLPNGVGFCLYVTRACLERIGAMPELYARGYYEDVEFGLRAREAGLRNVCATGVYVGHSGAQSFGAEKRALVLRNLAVLESRFPDHARECAAFLAADPLAPARLAIEARLAPPEGAILFVAPEGEALRLAEERAQVLARAEPDAVYLLCSAARDGSLVRFGALDGAAPRRLSFGLASLHDRAALGDYLHRLAPTIVEFFAPQELPEALTAALVALPTTRRLIVGDLRWLIAEPPALEKRCGNLSARGQCAGCATPTPSVSVDGRRLTLLARLIRACDELTPLDAMAAAFAATHLRGLPVVARVEPARARAPIALAPSCVLGVLAPCPTGETDRLISALARELRRREAGSLVVIGRCLDDLEAMASGNVFVVGPVEENDPTALLSLYGIGKLLSPYRTQGFGRLDALAQRAGAPKAYFDWSFGAMARQGGDLALDPRRCNKSAARALADWLLDEMPRETQS